MGYLHINNLYKTPNIFLFKEVYALEKIHGTSAHIGWTSDVSGEVKFFSGGATHEAFSALFNEDYLKKRFLALGHNDITVYGEAYGGKMQGMSKTYGDKLRFIAFDVKIGKRWLTVPEAELISRELGLEFVYYIRVPATIEALTEHRNTYSVQASRNLGISAIREGIVIRPLDELSDAYGNRVISKYKNDAFMETASKREVSPDKLQVLKDAEAIANEWVTDMRLRHVVDALHLYPVQIEHTGKVIKATLDDVRREGEGEIAWTKEAERAVCAAAAKLYKKSITDVKEYLVHHPPSGA